MESGILLKSQIRGKTVPRMWITTPKRTGILWTETPQVLGQNLTQSTYNSIWNRLIAGEKTWAEQRFSSEDMAVTAFPPVVTTPLAYVPQAIGITLARLFMEAVFSWLYGTAV